MPENPRLQLDFARERIGTVLWATGFRPDYTWLHHPVFDHKGQLRHAGGVVATPGAYALGLNFMRRRKSSFIHGAEDDVRELGSELLAHLGAHGCAKRQPAPFAVNPPGDAASELSLAVARASGQDLLVASARPQGSGWTETTVSRRQIIIEPGRAAARSR